MSLSSPARRLLTAGAVAGAVVLGGAGYAAAQSPAAREDCPDGGQAPDGGTDAEASAFATT